ncbi:VOC family protein [Panacibacter ginsenosidivorans]|uniref:VOC family protein n=1 Tax=Panacibacter ginsenosidivorans TaxID=1813871 RepID=A0A5B8V7P6_9BACT|nr:VOC family protein [Panacibacter ginsenosidivorans]QEC67289.1 VOC family protein [Panacibacter ginsenosidivorans]
MLIKELVLLTTDIAAVKKFYEELMGFPLIKETTQSVSFKTGNSILSFELTNSYLVPFYHVAFSIPNNKLNEALEWIEQRVPILIYLEKEQIADFKGWNAKAFYFHDAQQNILEFITHFDLHTNDENPFSASSVESICEIGIVTENVLATCEVIKTKYNIPYFEKGPFHNDFAVMGDSHGLFIISKTNRGWLPTQRPAEKFQVQVKIEVDGIDKELLFD